MTNTAVAEHNSDTTGLEPPASPPLLWKTPVASGVLTLIVGALVLGWPETSILVTATLFGVLLLVAGLAQVFSRSRFRVGLRPGAVHRRCAVAGLGHLVIPPLSNAYAILLQAIWIVVGFVFQGVQ